MAQPVLTKKAKPRSSHAVCILCVHTPVCTFCWCRTYLQKHCTRWPHKL